MLVAQSRLDDRRQIIVSIGVHQFDPAIIAPCFGLNHYRALIDTGAIRSCLTYSAVAEEGLQRHGKTLVKNVHNMNLHGLYLANIGIFSTHRIESGTLNLESSYYAFGEPIEIMDIANNERFDAILGMDLLSRCEFEYDKTGTFTLRLP
jgi:Aspartyl protease